jgi:hypothetical protein
MKHIKLFENFGQESSKYDKAKDFIKQHNPEYNYVVFSINEPVSGWHYIYDAVVDGVLEGIMGYSEYELDDSLGDVFQTAAYYGDEEFDSDNEHFEDHVDINWKNFESTLEKFVNHFNEFYDETYNISIVKI